MITMNTNRDASYLCTDGAWFCNFGPVMSLEGAAHEAE
jgi:hypothetical protein